MWHYKMTLSKYSYWYSTVLWDRVLYIESFRTLYLQYSTLVLRDRDRVQYCTVLLRTVVSLVRRMLRIKPVGLESTLTLTGHDSSFCLRSHIFAPRHLFFGQFLLLSLVAPPFLMHYLYYFSMYTKITRPGQGWWGGGPKPSFTR